ncbi:DnaJ C-terminal domain-containing protein [Tropicimonas sp. IMCC34043]|uniref:DnaJ C-terminal domain-containing protein n=1 Tax=Tropicimonas sp. IMCC34043 TaxID=2248760 RepID=UPI000E248D4E|nr:DnaJ C-terminal domain-containing protein [Tropicimonas sp. IMCC34043]
MAKDTLKDPYEALGVAKTASDAEIKKAYRQLAKKLHPDLNAGDAGKLEQFKAVSAAYDLLRDAEKRRRFDAGEIDSSGQERPQRQYYRQYAESDPSNRYEFDGGMDDLGDIFSRAFRSHGQGGQGGFSGGPSGGQSQFRMRGADRHFHMEVDFLDAVQGVSRTVTLPEVGRIEVSIPAGIEDGQTLRLAGKGEPGIGGGPAGDAMVRIAVRPDAVFTREGNDLLLELPVSIDEAVLGGSVEVPVPGGRVKLKVPPNSSSGRVMRLRGKGVAPARGTPGDLLVTLKIVLSESDDTALADAVRAWRAKNHYDPRAGWRGNRS